MKVGLSILLKVQEIWLFIIQFVEICLTFPLVVVVPIRKESGLPSTLVSSTCILQNPRNFVNIEVTFENILFYYA